MNNICVLDPYQAEQLRQGLRPNCREHYHTTRDAARLLVLGADFPGMKDKLTVRARGEARWALLTDGKYSNRHIVVFDSFTWRAVAQHVSFGRGMSTMQLVSIRHQFRGKGRHYAENDPNDPSPGLDLAARDAAYKKLKEARKQMRAKANATIENLAN